MKHYRLLPKFIRFRDAPLYLGMDRYRFNNEVRPHLIEIPIGQNITNNVMVVLRHLNPGG